MATDDLANDEDAVDGSGLKVATAVRRRVMRSVRQPPHAAAPCRRRNSHRSQKRTVRIDLKFSQKRSRVFDLIHAPRLQSAAAAS
jgi:hypothetical protein